MFMGRPAKAASMDSLPWGVRDRESAIQIISNLPNGPVMRRFLRLAKRGDWRRVIKDAAAYVESGCGITG